LVYRDGSLRLGSVHARSRLRCQPVMLAQRAQ